MVQRTIEVSRALGLHPANLLLYLAELGANFDDVWPEVDDAWVGALRTKHWQRFGEKVKGAVSVPPSSTATRLGVSKDAALVVEKLWRNGRWGSATVSPESMQKHTHLTSDRIDRAIVELRKEGLLLCQGESGPYSLNPGKRAEIERIGKLMTEGG